MPSCFSLECRPRRPAEQLTAYSLQELERATDGFAESSLLGTGSYGFVYKATLDSGKLVAVKRPISLNSDGSTHSSRLLGNKEFTILSKVHCSHVVNLLGFCHNRNETLLVVELMGNGTLHDALHQTGAGAAGRPVLSWSMRARFLLQVGKALKGLHAADPQIIHRDIKSSNILIDAKWDARLGDFGLAVQGEFGDIMCTPAGTLGYFDPRYDHPEKLSTKIDVFSFGVLVLEVLTGRLVLDAQRKPVYVVEWALPLIKQNKPLAICDPRLRLPNKTRALKRMAFIAARCIRLSPSKRPSMAEVVSELSLVSTSLSWRRRNMSRITKVIAAN